MQTIATLTPKTPIRIRRIPPNRLAPAANRHPTTAILPTLLIDQIIGAPVLVDGAALRPKGVVAVVHLDGAGLERERAVPVDGVVRYIARAVEARVAAGGHGGVEVGGPVGVARVGEETA